MVAARASSLAVRWVFPLVLILVNIAVCEGADKKKNTKGGGKNAKGEAAKKDEGVKFPGDPDYWTKLLGLGFSEGTLRPSFSPSVLNYKLDIKSGKSKELLLTPMINVNKYELLFKPKLIWNGVDTDYSPIQNIEFKQVLNETGPGPLHTKMTVEVRDPKNNGGLFAGGAKSHVYTIQLTQAPDIEKIVTATKIEVVAHTRKGKLVKPPNTYDPTSPRNEIRYMVDEDVQFVDVTVDCPKEATGLKYNGRTAKAGTVYHSQAFEGATKSILGQCIYKDKRWTEGQEMQRTYVITIARNASLHDTTVDLRMWPPSQDGVCERLDVDSKILKDGDPNQYYGLDPGWKCMKGPPSAQFVGSYDNPHAELVVINKKSGGRYRLWNGIPTQVPTTNGIHEDRLVLEAGMHKRNYTFLFGPPPQCSTFHWQDNRDAALPWKVDSQTSNYSWKCPDKDGFHMEVNLVTREYYCRWVHCTPAHDTEKCCTKVRQPCAKYDQSKYGAMHCPKHLVFNPAKQCSAWPCTNSKIDKHHCCTPEVKGGAAPCTSIACPPDSVFVDDAASLNCFTNLCNAEDESTCCQRRAICNSMVCPRGFSQKYNSALYLCAGNPCVITDRDMCCDAAAYCNEFTCPGVGVNHHLGWLPKLNSANIPCGGDPCIEWDTGICCNKMGFCGSFTCPVGFFMKQDAEQIPCEGGGMHKCTEENDLTKCCQPAANCIESEVCTVGYHFKVGAELLLCRSAVCQATDRELCCDLVNPFEAATSTRLIAGKGEGVCKMLDGPTYFSCQATGKHLNLEVEYAFDKPVGNKVFMGQHMIQGKVATVKIPSIVVPEKQKLMRANVDSVIAGRGAVEHRLQIMVVPPGGAKKKGAAPTEAPTEAPTAAPTPAPQKASTSSKDKESSSSSEKAPSPSSKASTSSKDKDKAESKASSSKSDTPSKKSKSTSGSTEAKGKESSSGKASKDSSSSSGKPSKDSNSTSGTVEHARLLEQRRLTEAALSDADSVVV